MFTIRQLATAARTAAQKASRSKHSLPELPYEYAALEPVISREIMSLHHAKHHNTYVTNLNAAEDKLRCATEKGDIDTIISLAPALKFNGGGHLNHSIFWQNLSPCQTEPSPELCTAFTNDFGSVENMKKLLSAQTTAIQGSGWGWLGYNPTSKKLQIVTCSNQDPLQATTGLVPLLGIDVWEHAYYLQYKNVRADYVKAIFDIVNWKDVSERYKKAVGC